MGTKFSRLQSDLFELVMISDQDKKFKAHPELTTLKKREEKIDDLFKALAQENPKMGSDIQKIIHDDTGYNFLQALFSNTTNYETLRWRVDLFQKYVRDFDLNYQSPKDKNTLLHIVARWKLCNTGDAEFDLSVKTTLSDLFQEILVEGPKLDVICTAGTTPLMIAAKSNLVCGVEELVGAGASVAASGFKGVDDAVTIVCTERGNVECLQSLVARLPSEMKLNSFYKNIDYPPLFRAAWSNSKNLFEFLIKNNFDLSDWKEQYPLILASTSNSPYFVPNSKRSNEDRKFLAPPKFDLLAVQKQQNPLFEEKSFREVIKSCAGNALAQAALLCHFPFFSYRVDSFNPSIKTKLLPSHASILHVIGSYNPQNNSEISTAVDFVDTIRDKCTKYSENGRYDWLVRDDNNLTPFDYNTIVNGFAPAQKSQTVKDAIEITLTNTYSALVFLETFKHNQENLKFDVFIDNPSSIDVFDIFCLSPEDGLGAGVVALTLEGRKSNRNQFSDSSCGRVANHFRNLEHLVVQNTSAEVEAMFTEDNDNQEFSGLKKLKTLTVKNHTKTTIAKSLKKILTAHSQEGFEKLAVLQDGQRVT